MITPVGRAKGPTTLWSQPSRARRGLCAVTACAMLALLGGCSSAPPRQPLPPSASDLNPMQPHHLCETQAEVLANVPRHAVHSVAWGDGQEVQVDASHSRVHGEESWYIDPEGLLVGAVFTFPAGLPLDDYPVLRETLSSLRSARDFYLAVAQLPTKSRMDVTRLFQTGEEKTTHQYLVTGTADRPTLLMATFTIDPYVSLFSPFRKEFLDRLRGPESAKTSQGTVDPLPYPALLQFARGETALLAYCGTRRPAIASDGYRRSIEAGMKGDPTRLAEAYHKLGLAYEATGALDQARTAMEQSLTLRPNIPEVVNNLGTIYLQLKDRARAMELFERAVSLRPNYPLARFNLAEAVEPSNPKLALEEYETYLALVEDLPEEQARAALVKQRLKQLRH